MEKNRGGEAEERGRRGYGWRDPRSRGTRKEEEEEEEDDDDDDDDDDTGSRVRSTLSADSGSFGSLNE